MNTPKIFALLEACEEAAVRGLEAALAECVHRADPGHPPDPLQVRNRTSDYLEQILRLGRIRRMLDESSVVSPQSSVVSGQWSETVLDGATAADLRAAFARQNARMLAMEAKLRHMEARS